VTRIAPRRVRWLRRSQSLRPRAQAVDADQAPDVAAPRARRQADDATAMCANHSTWIPRVGNRWQAFFVIKEKRRDERIA
jgi:hypothetical protein